MPVVNGEEYPYTKAGIRAAAAARKKKGLIWKGPKLSKAFLNFASGGEGQRGPTREQAGEKFRTYAVKEPRKVPKGMGKAAAKDPDARDVMRQYREGRKKRKK